MKGLPALFLLALSILGCGPGGNYLSMVEAKAACRDWKDQGGTYDKVVRDEYFYNSYLKKPSSEVQINLEEPIPPQGMYEEFRDIPRRVCQLEQETKQYIGYEKPVPRNEFIICRASTYSTTDVDERCELHYYDSDNIKAHFRY